MNFKQFNLNFKLNKRISKVEIAIFFRQLAILIAAGVPIVQSFEILAKGQKNLQLNKLINSIKTEIEIGKNLVAALRKFPRYFNELNCHLVHIGEQTGKLEAMLKRIAHYEEKSLALKNQIRHALFYPTIIFLVAISVSIIMLTFVVPRFAELFLSMHGHLPTFTLLVINFSRLLRENFWLGIFPIIGIPIFIFYFKTSRRLRQHFDFIMLKVPFLSSVLRKIILVRFTRSLATTFAAGLPITEALKIVANTCGNYYYFKTILNLQAKVSAGLQLHAAMMQNNILFSALTIQMVKVGEESGALESMLERVAELYETDLDSLVKTLKDLLEPLIMLILGALIGGLVIAMYLPIFKLGTII